MLIDAGTAASPVKSTPPTPRSIVTITKIATYLLVLAYLVASAGLLVKACKWALAQW